MSSAASEESLVVAGVEARRWPALLRGTLVLPRWPTVGEVSRAMAANDGVHSSGDLHLVVTSGPVEARVQVDVHPALSAHELVEPDPSAAVAELMALPSATVSRLVDACGRELAARADQLASALAGGSAAPPNRRSLAEAALVAGLFDGAAVGDLVRAALPGHRSAALDGWVALPERGTSGITQRVAAADAALGPIGAESSPPLLRGVPTTQLHVTAGNAAVVPVTSLLWGWAAKGAVVLKPARATARLMSVVAKALVAVAPEHPLVRHTSITYWRGGDPDVENGLFAPGAFDRVVVWGSVATVESVARRAATADLVVMRPRHGLSLIGVAAVEAEDTVARAAADSVVADQQACMSSLVHVVEGSPSVADRYAVRLAELLARWDEQLPAAPSAAVVGRLLELRRGALATADWRLNGNWPHVRSAVVRSDHLLPLGEHPGGRMVLVLAVPDLEEALPGLVGRDVSHVGIASVGDSLRSRLAALGVDNVLPLGEAEREYAGRPHDGMNVVDRLVRWVSG